MEEVKYKANIKKIGDLVIDVFTFYSEDGISEKDYNPKEITPEQLKEAIEDSERKIRKAFEEKLKEAKKKYGGKYLPNLETFSLFEKYPKLVRTETKYLTSIDSLTEFNNIKKAIEETDKKLKEKIPEDRVLITIKINYSFGYDCRDVVADIYADYLVFAMPDEKIIKMTATMNALYHNFFPVFSYDCQAIKEFLEGYLTFKGFAKRLSPFRKRSC